MHSQAAIQKFWVSEIFFKEVSHAHSPRLNLYVRVIQSMFLYVPDVK